MPWSGFFAALHDIGSAGHLAVEFECWECDRRVPGSDPVAAARLSRELLRRLEP